MTITWNQALINLLYKKIEDPKNIASTIEVIYNYILSKSPQRIVSPIYFDVFERNHLFSTFCTHYSKMNVSEICESPLMKALVTHNGDNNENIDFICRQLIPSQLASWPDDDYQTRNNLSLFKWLANFFATTADPEAIKNHQLILNTPPEYQKIYMDGRNQLGSYLAEALKNGWLNKGILKEIHQKITKEEIEFEPAFKKESIVDFFVYRYQKLIVMGKEYREQFKKAVLHGILIFMDNPIIPS